MSQSPKSEIRKGARSCQEPRLGSASRVRAGGKQAGRVLTDKLRFPTVCLKIEQNRLARPQCPPQTAEQGLAAVV